MFNLLSKSVVIITHKKVTCIHSTVSSTCQKQNDEALIIFYFNEGTVTEQFTGLFGLTVISHRAMIQTRALWSRHSALILGLGLNPGCAQQSPVNLQHTCWDLALREVGLIGLACVVGVSILKKSPSNLILQTS